MRGKPVVAFDIDGTMSDYHAHFLRFAQEWYGRPMPDPSENTDGVPLYQWMRTSRAKYRQCKLAFRQGGLKRSMPCYEGISELTHDLRKRGCEVWICTTRPYLHLSNIDPDTREWLRRNHVQYDNVLYGAHKYRDLVKEVKPENVVGVVDDLPEMTRQALALGLRPVILREQPYNQKASLFDDFTHACDTVQGIRSVLMESLDNWKVSRNG